jgi:hypothetical protein
VTVSASHRVRGAKPPGRAPTNVMMTISNHDEAYGSIDGSTRSDVTMVEVGRSGVGLESIYQVCELC